MSAGLWLVFLIVFLSAGSLFFSVAVISLRTVSRGKLAEVFKSFGKGSSADELGADSERLAMVCVFYRLFLNVLVLICFFLIFTALRPREAEVGDYILTVLLSFAIFLFSLSVASAWAKYAGENFFGRTYGVLRFFSMIVGPVFYLRHFTDVLVRRLAGVPEDGAEEKTDVKQEEFLTDLEMAGVADAEEQAMIENVLELTDTTVEEIMTPRTDIKAVEVSSGRRTVLDTITKAGHSRVPVYEDDIDHIVGLIYAKDLLSEIDREESEFNLSEKMRDAYFVPETKYLRVLLHEFQNQKLHAAIVLDEYGGTAGIVTIEDILEELVGEITDEYEKTPISAIRQVGENVFEVDARTDIDDVNDELGLDLPEEEDYETLGGFVFSYLGYIPKTEESFEYEGIGFTISSAETRRIRRIRMKLPVRDEQEKSG